MEKQIQSLNFSPNFYRLLSVNTSNSFMQHRSLQFSLMINSLYNAVCCRSTATLYVLECVLSFLEVGRQYRGFLWCRNLCWGLECCPA